MRTILFQANSANIVRLHQMLSPQQPPVLPEIVQRHPRLPSCFSAFYLFWFRCPSLAFTPFVHVFCDVFCLNMYIHFQLCIYIHIHKHVEFYIPANEAVRSYFLHKYIYMHFINAILSIIVDVYFIICCNEWCVDITIKMTNRSYKWLLMVWLIAWTSIIIYQRCSGVKHVSKCVVLWPMMRRYTEKLSIFL